MRARSLFSSMVVVSLTLAAAGCYENTGAAPPSPGPTPTPVQEQGPLTSFGQQPASSALGKAKKTAGNIADRAEQHSQQVADQADEMMNPKPRTSSDQPVTDGEDGSEGG